MKKNFFKKLASVLSLALVVTTIAPAAGTTASAAASPDLAKRYTTVYEGSSREYAVKNTTGYTVKWSVSGTGAKVSKATGTKTVLTVATKGAKAGNVVVSAKFYKGTKLVRTAKDTVATKVSAKAATITTADTSVVLTAIKAGTVVDFNRKLTPANSTSKQYWAVTKKDGKATTATIDALGKFTATENGEYTITLTMRNAATSKVLTTATQDVKVVGGKIVTSIAALTTTAVEVKFAQKVDAVAAANFEIPAIAVTAATLSADGMSAILTVAPLKPNATYEVTIKDVKVDAVAQATETKTMVVPAVTALYNPTLTVSKEVIKADGASQAIVTFSLKDALGNVLVNAKDVEVAFTTTFGQLAQNRVALQNGEAKLLLTSEFLTSNKVADLRAVVIEAQDANLIGLKAEASILISPNPEEAAVEALGASMTGAESNQADRVVLYFNKDVTVAQYVNATTGVIDAAKAIIEVRENATTAVTGSAVTVRGLLPVAGNSKALQVLLDVEGNAANALTDNSNVYVGFTDKTGSVDVARTTTFKLTDARKPAMLSLASEGLKKLVITFSEPVDETTAEAAANWKIDGIAIDNAMYNATAAVGTFDIVKGIDQRHIVTITLGTGKFLTAGSHSVQASNIGDWASLTDTPANIMNTQTLDFTIAADTSKPEATVEVMSPEQWLVTYNRDVEENAAALTTGLTLQVYNSTAGTWGTDAMNASLLVTKVTGSDNKFLVEVTQDWTQRHLTATSNKNYFNFNYRLSIVANAVTNASNGLKNDAQQLPLTGAMTTPDTSSPIISDIIEVTAATAYKAVMNEPVKMAVSNNEGTTLAQSQASLPVVTAEFIKADYSKTIPGTVGVAFADQYDKEINVTPATPLEAGNWILVVRSISDDIGNTAASATKQFTVAGSPTAANDFRVLFTFADTDMDKTVEAVDGAEADATKDYLFVKFSKAVKVSGGVANALSTTNYTLNGQALPLGTQIRSNIAGYDDLDTTTDSITIELPQGTLANRNTPHVLNISNTITSATNEALVNGGEKALPFEVVSGDLTNLPADLAAYTLVNAVKTQLAVITGGVSVQGDFDTFETAYEAAQVAITALDNASIAGDLDMSHVAASYQTLIDGYKATAKADAQFAFVVTAASPTTVSVKLAAGADITNISAAAEYTVAYSLANIAVVNPADLTVAIAAVADGLANNTVMTVTDVFWGVSDTVTITTTAPDAVVVTAN